MTKLEIFNGLMKKAKYMGYEGPDYKYQLGHILDGTNAYALFFREDFSKAIWGTSDITFDTKRSPKWKVGITKLAVAEDKWKFLENNVLLD